MSKKEKLIVRLCSKPIPRNFTLSELYTLVQCCGCTIKQGGRGSGIRIVHIEKKRVLAFDRPHPGNELYSWQVQAVIDFLKEIGEIKDGNEV